MSYFEILPKIYYDSKGDGKFDLLTNIMTRVKLRDDVKNDIFAYDYYDIQDGETPEMIAHKYYNDPELHWTILIANNITDYYSEWPMSVQRFEEFVNDKYPTSEVMGGAGGIHHYEINATSGDTTKTIDVGSGLLNRASHPSATVVSNYTYETRIQDKLRRIRLIKPEFIGQFVDEFEEKVDEVL
tara:strand:+ start:7400 stop:7954 length:555 start_codon:yes stop_codon:yes gene_type:complete